MKKRPFFRAATAGLGKYHTGGYGRIGVYRVNLVDLKSRIKETCQRRYNSAAGNAHKCHHSLMG